MSMTTPRRARMTRRLGLILLLLVSLGLGSGVILFALRDNIVFFVTPSDLLRLEEGKSDRLLRLGGLVAPSSVRRDEESGEVRFVLTDGVSRVEVRYRGLLPSLFREGTGVVALGQVSEGGRESLVFRAEQILAKHDEYYMPRGLEEELKKRGLWQEMNRP